MMRKGIPKEKGQHIETTRGKSNATTRLGEEIEGGRAVESKDVKWQVGLLRASVVE